MSQAQAHNLVKFAKYGKLLGNSLAVIDFGSRVGNIHSSYKAGENWEREMFIESSSFAASAVVGIGAVKFCVFLVGLTPVGWVGLIAGGLVVAGATAASMGMDSLVKAHSGSWYDEAMELMR